MSVMTEQERKKRLAQSLLRGEPIAVNSTGRIETTEEARDNGDITMRLPEGKMA